MQILPNQNSPFVKLPSGLIVPPWNSYLQQFTQAPPVAVAIDVDTSPFEYTAVEPGQVAYIGGTVSVFQLIRGGVQINTNSNFLLLGVNDRARIIYSVLPTMYFIPMYGNSPR